MAAEGVHGQLSHCHPLDIVYTTEALPPLELMLTEQKQTILCHPSKTLIGK